MTLKRQREIVIEFEKVQTIRKRAMTRLVDCGECRETSDAVSLHEASELFETTYEQLFEFVLLNRGHYHVSIDDRVYLCVPSLLEIMKRKDGMRRLAASEGNV